ncbi:proline-specific peptidase [Pseudovirgaria hyperparasitica]|uniref:Proline-specific peptidase n=1 Tax=Pseudovirgaria hyperparasitica TaxID=470096 RepID=A0A6A6W2E8_9PEZI|nr:proline-specific peptidase [Pseudovirgaria hyperparasitica]KAF2756299.1 proline-specific peptidase [Pseudovirgaria hyperparasitica]
MRAPQVISGTVTWTPPGLDQSVQTWYKTIGDIQAFTPLLILHGGPAATHEYLLPLTDLARARIPLIFYDQLGCGASTILPARAGDQTFWSVALFITELQTLVNHLGLHDRKFDVYGHSWGGMLAAEYAIAQPDRVRRLVLGGALASIKDFKDGLARLRDALPPDVQRALGEAERMGDFTSPEYEAAMEVWFKRHVSLSRPFPCPEMANVLGWFEKDGKEGGSKVYETMYGPSELAPNGVLKDWSVVDRLGDIRAPTLLLNGDEDEATEEAMRPFFERIDKVKWTTLADAAHFAHVEQTEQYVALIKAFLSDGN